ncbi:hypothetical protein [Candidatus Villigracilis saccharophilus]
MAAHSVHWPAKTHKDKPVHPVTFLLRNQRRAMLESDDPTNPLG